MSTRTCQYCGIPVRVGRAPAGPVYCCSGCAIADKIPIDANGQFPVNKALVGVLVLGFLLFNQILFAVLYAIALHQAKPSLAHTSALISAGLAVLVCFILALAARFSGRYSFTEKLPGLLVAGLTVWALSQQPPQLFFLAAANSALLLWTIRGVRRGRRSKNSNDPV